MYSICPILCNRTNTLPTSELLKLLKCEKKAKDQFINVIFFRIQVIKLMVSTSLAIPDNLLYQEKWVRFKYLAVIKIYETIKQSLCVSFLKRGIF